MNKSILLFGLVFLLVASFASADLKDNNEQYFSFDTGNYSGNDIYDLSGNLNNGTNVGGAQFATGILNQSWDWDAGTDYVDTGYTLPSSWSISTWVNPDSLTLQGTLYSSVALQSSNRDGIIISYAPTTGYLVVSMYLGNSAVLNWQPGPSIVAGEWQHVVVTYNASTNAVAAYINSTKYTSSSSNDPGQDQTLRLGKWSNDNSVRTLEGKLDEFAIWNNRILNDSDVAALWNNSAGFNPYTILGNVTPPTPPNMTTRTGFDEYFINTPLARYYLNDSLPTDSQVLESWNYMWNGTATDWNLTNGTYTDGAINQTHDVSSMLKFGKSVNLSVNDSFVQTPGFNVGNRINSSHPFANPDAWYEYGQNFTYSFWFKSYNWNITDASEDRYILLANQGHQIIITDLGKIRFNADTTNQILPGQPEYTTSAGAYNEDTWYYLSFTNIVNSSGNYSTYYLNGEPIYNFTNKGIWAGWYSNIRRGLGDTDSGLREIKANIDEFKVFNTTLTQAQIIEEMDSVGLNTAEDILAYYNFDQDLGDVVVDRHNKGQNVEFPYMPNQAVPYNESSLTFDGIYDYIQLDTPLVTSDTNATVISFWAKPEAHGLAESLPLLSSSTSSTALTLDLNLDRVIWNSGDGLSSCTYSFPSIPASEWSHFLLYSNVTTCEIRLNTVLGTPVSSDEVDLDFDYIGRNAGFTEHFKGLLSNLRIYNTTLTDNEIDTLYYGNKNLTVLATELLTNNTISSYNVTSIYNNGSTTNYSISLIVPLTTMNLSMTNELGYGNVTDRLFDITTATTSVSFANLTNVVWTLFANESINGNPILGTSMTIVSPFGSLTNSSAGSNITFYTVAGNYTVTTSKSTYNTNVTNITLNGPTQTNTILLNEFNTLFINLYDEITRALLVGEPMSLVIVGTDAAFNLTTSNGTQKLRNLTAGDYEVRYVSTDLTDYPLRSIYFTFINDSVQQLNLYSLNESSNLTTATITFQIVDQDFNLVEGARVVTARYYANINSYLDIWARDSNSQGLAIGEFQTVNAFYQYRVLYEGVEKFTSLDTGEQFNFDATKTIIINIDEEDEFRTADGVITSLIYTNLTNRTGFFDFQFSYAASIEACLEVWHYTSSGVIFNETCVIGTGSNLYFNVNVPSGVDTFTAKGKIKFIGGQEYIYKEAKTVQVGLPLAFTDSDVGFVTAQIVAWLLVAAGLLLFIKFPTVALLTEGVTFLAIALLPIKILNTGAEVGIGVLCIIGFVIITVKTK